MPELLRLARYAPGLIWPATFRFGPPKSPLFRRNVHLGLRIPCRRRPRRVSAILLVLHHPKVDFQPYTFRVPLGSFWFFLVPVLFRFGPFWFLLVPFGSFWFPSFFGSVLFGSFWFLLVPFGSFWFRVRLGATILVPDVWPKVSCVFRHFWTLRAWVWLSRQLAQEKATAPPRQMLLGAAQTR